MFGKSRQQEQARQTVGEANDVLSNVQSTSGWSAKDKRIYQEGIDLTRQRRDAANQTLGK